MPISRVRIRSADFSGDPKVLAPGIGGLQADTPRWPHRETYRHSVVVIGVDAGEHVRLPELRIRSDEVLRESVVPKDGAIHERRDRRQTAVTRGTRCIVQ